MCTSLFLPTISIRTPSMSIGLATYRRKLSKRHTGKLIHLNVLCRPRSEPGGLFPHES
jgi:hypothetical protein